MSVLVGAEHGIEVDGLRVFGGEERRALECGLLDERAGEQDRTGERLPRADADVRDLGG